MAVIHIDKGFSIKATQAWPYTITESTADTVTLEGDTQSLTLNGEFTYNGDQINGIVDSATFVRNGDTVYTISDIGRSASLLQDALDLVQAHAEPEILFAYLFSGADEMYGSADRDVILGFDGDDQIWGGGGDDRLLGNAGNDMLDGGGGRDVLKAGYGDDIVNGGSGNNLLFTGLGSDTIVVNHRNAGIDTIAGFEQGKDTIELWSGAGVAFDNLGADGTLDANLFASNASGEAVEADDRIVYDSDSGELYYDADGSGAGAKVQFGLIGITDHAAMTAADFSVHNV